MHQIVLASASPSRRAILSRAGVTPSVLVSSVDEDAVVAASGVREPRAVASLLARAKAEDVAAQLLDAPTEGVRVVIGCDSVLELDGVAYGKPHTRERAKEQWTRMNGREAALHTGHWLVDADGASVGGLSTATVSLARLSEAEIDAYIDTDEPLEVAGALTIDGLGGPFVSGIVGDHHGVLGLSLPLCRTLIADLGYSWVDFWDRRQG